MSAAPPVSPPSQPPPPAVPTAPPPPRSAPRWLILAILAATGLAVGFNAWVRKTAPRQEIASEIPIRSTIKKDITLTERNGQSVNFLDLKGKVVLVSYVYTVCPHGCAAVIGEMRKLLDKYRGRPDFHLVSMAVLPDHDTPAFLKSYADGLGLSPADPWWFLTGDRTAIWDFMDHQLRLTPAVPIPEADRLNPLDTYDHDLRIVLIDRDSNIRGYYSVFHPDSAVAAMMAENLEKHTTALLDQP